MIRRAPTARVARIPGGCLAAFALLASPPTRADGETPPPAEPAPDPDDQAKTSGKAGTLEVRGRVLARGELVRREVAIVDAGGIPRDTTRDSFDLWIPSVRLSLKYQAAVPWLSGEVDVDIADKPYLKDAYGQAKGRHAAIRVGQFKMPISAIEMASPWTLPLARRGFLHDLLTDRLDIAGRRPGVMATWRARGKLDPRLIVGAFQGSVVVAETADGRETDLIRERNLSSQSLVARAQIEPGKAVLGAYYEHRVGTPGIFTTRRFWTAGLDAEYERKFDHGGFRVWFDALAGASWFEHDRKQADGDDATFLATRLLVAHRWGGRKDGERYLEPVLQLGLLEPDLDVVADVAWEAVCGLNAGLWRSVRLSLQAEINQARRNFPQGYFLGRDPDRLAVVAQMGMAF